MRTVDFLEASFGGGRESDIFTTSLVDSYDFDPSVSVEDFSLGESVSIKSGYPVGSPINHDLGEKLEEWLRDH